MLNLLEFATLFLVGKFGVKVLIYIKNLYPPLCPRLLDLVQLGDEVDVKFIGVCNAFLGGKIWCGDKLQAQRDERHFGIGRLLTLTFPL